MSRRSTRNNRENSPISNEVTKQINTDYLGILRFLSTQGHLETRLKRANSKKVIDDSVVSHKNSNDYYYEYKEIYDNEINEITLDIDTSEFDIFDEWAKSNKYKSKGA